MSAAKFEPVPEFGWVDVDDEMPERHTFVLVRMMGRPFLGSRHIVATWGKRQWVSATGEPFQYITHWSHIPEPVDDSVVLIIDEPSEIPQEVLDAFRLGKPPTTNLDHMTAQIDELDGVVCKLLDRVKILEVRRTATPKETRDAAMGVIDRSQLAALEDKIDKLEKRPYHAPLQRRTAKGEPIMGTLITPKPPACHCTSNLLGCHLSMEGVISCIQCGGDVTRP